MNLQIIRTICLIYVFAFYSTMAKASEVQVSNVDSPELQSTHLEPLSTEEELFGLLMDPFDESMAAFSVSGHNKKSVSKVAGNDLSNMKSNDPININENAINEVLTDTGKEFKNIRQQFMLDQVKSIESSADDSQTDGLNEIITQLDKLQVPEKTVFVEPFEQATPQEPVEAVVPIHSEEPKVSQEPAMMEESAIEVTADEVIVSIEKIEMPLHPLKLADVLYRQGCFQQALKYYQLVNEQLDEESVVDRQWVLFQMANCCRQSDSQKAVQLYSELINAYPNSQWAGIALGRQKTIEWDHLNQIEEEYFADRVRDAETQ